MTDSSDLKTTSGGEGGTPADLPRHVLDNLLEGCQVISRDFRYLYVNEAVAVHGRTTREELLGRTMMEAYPGIEDTEMFSVLRRCMEERAPQLLENEFTFPDGSKGWFELRFEPVPEGVTILSMDITARKHAEAAFRRTNRALITLSECNQTLVRATDEGRFMEDVCRVVVEKGGYRLAWIGMSDGESDHSVRPVAHAGLDETHAELAPVAWDETEHDAGPVGVVIRTGESAVTRFVANDPGLEPWCRDALDRGLASRIVLPIRNNGDIFGALTIYAADPDAFDDAEHALLDEMALDLGFGIETIRQRATRRQAEARVEHLNAVLRGIRNVNQLITRERDPEALIQQACELLVESRGFDACLLLLPKPGQGDLVADAGAPVRLRRLRELLEQGGLPDCMRTVQGDGDQVVRRCGSDGCQACPSAQDVDARQEAMASRLEDSGGQIHGYLLALLPPGVAFDAEELDLLREIAGDLAFALQSIAKAAELEAAERARRESERRYDLLFRENQAGIAVHEIICDGEDHPVNYRFLDVNPAFTKLTGLDREAIVGRTVREVIPDIEPTWIERYGRVALTGETAWFEQQSDPLGRFFEVTAFRPAPRQFAATFFDVTERRTAQEELRESQRKMATLLANLPGMAYRCRNDRAWTMEFVSNGSVGLTGYRPEDLVENRTASYGDLIHPGDRDWVYDEVQRADAEQRPFRIEYRIVTADGLHRWVRERGVAVRSPDGSVEGIEGFIADITPLVDAELATRKSEEKHRAMFEKLPIQTLMWQRVEEDFVLDSVNEAARTATEDKISEWLGRPASELFTHAPRVISNLQNCYEHHTFVREELEYRYRSTGKTRQIVMTFMFIPPDLVMLLAEDVTEKKQLEDQLGLSQRLEAVGRLAGGVAHDFNNLLTVINSYAMFAINELRESDPIRADVKEIQKAGDRAAALTRQLLAFSRKQILEPEVLSLNKVVSGIESMLRRLLGEDIEIVVSLTDEIGSVEADPGQLEQVIMNLAVNARDAMPQGGRLTIETCAVELDEDYAEQHVSAAPGSYVRLSVSDTGAGIDAQTRDRIFEPFFTTKEKGKGTGLGLSTVYGIVKQSGGNIWVYSEPGQGTTFKVYLPRVDAPAIDARRKTMPVMASGSETVLVVEDEDAVRKIAERMLRMAGYHVLSAANGGEALLLCERHGDEIDLLVTDVVMPQMSGRELAERLAKLCPKIKMLFMSGYTDNAIVHHGVLDPGTRFIGKPFSGADLTRKVREVLDEE